MHKLSDAYYKKGDKIPLPRNLITTFSIIPHCISQYNTPCIVFLASFIFHPHIITYMLLRSMVILYASRIKLPPFKYGCARSLQAPGASIFSILLSHTGLLLPPNTAAP